MSSKDLSLGFLFDFYGELLSEQRKNVFDLYYNEDLSLAEVAEQVGITRQGVRDTVKKAEKQLLEYESKLGLAGRFEGISADCESIVKKLEELGRELGTREDINDLIADVKRLAEIQ
jgi:predicted DNA-binding protein YlxM (UPF0122 family)